MDDNPVSAEIHHCAPLPPPGPQPEQQWSGAFKNARRFFGLCLRMSMGKMQPFARVPFKSRSAFLNLFIEITRGRSVCFRIDSHRVVCAEPACALSW